MLLQGQAGEVREGALADLLVIAGEPQNDVRVLQAAANVKLVMKDGRIHKNLFDGRH
jgi:imidazolonepropionase-like amidohydrolase